MSTDAEIRTRPGPAYVCGLKASRQTQLVERGAAAGAETYIASSLGFSLNNRRVHVSMSDVLGPYAAPRMAL